MTIRDLMNQFYIQGAYCIKEWRNNANDCVILAEGTDFESECWKIKEDYLNTEISYMYAIDGVLHIELECE